MRTLIVIIIAVVLLVAVVSVSIGGSEPAERTLLHVSFDPTRELFGALNPIFAAEWRAGTGERIEIRQSHGGSGKQTRAVLDGLEADVVSLATAHDVDVLAEKGGLLDAGWRERGAHGSSPFYSTIVLVVRHGNPKRILDWEDLAREGVRVTTSNPKTSGGARWNYLAMWVHGRSRQRDATEQERERDAEAFVSRVFANVAVLDAGARGATNTFAQRGMGDVLIAWESEAMLLRESFADQGFEVVYPSKNMRAQLPAAVVDQNAERHGTRDLAEAYVRFLYGPAAQEQIAAHFFRPTDPTVAAAHRGRFREVELTSVEEVFGTWRAAHEKHFAAGGVLDRILTRDGRSEENSKQEGANGDKGRGG